MNGPARVLIFIGALLLLAGIILWFLGNRLDWIGKLPGDLRIEKENFRLYFPLSTMLLISAVVSVLIWLFRRFF